MPTATKPTPSKRRFFVASKLKDLSRIAIDPAFAEWEEDIKAGRGRVVTYLFTLREASRYLGISVSDVLKKIAANEIEVFTPPSGKGQLRVLVNDVIPVLDNQN